jgi:putative membrane protein
MSVLYILMLLLVLVVIISHIAFMLMEVVFWTHPKVRRIFAMSEEKAIDSKVLASNVGLYNGCLAAGLIWGLWEGSLSLLTFFLCSIFIAGCYGGFTAKRSILYIQALPAALALVLVWINYSY